MQNSMSEMQSGPIDVHSVYYIHISFEFLCSSIQFQAYGSSKLVNTTCFI